MTYINDLKSVVMFNNLNVSMLEKLSNIASVKTYKTSDYIFNEGDDAKNFYAVIEGRVRLEIDKKYTTRISINDIVQGMAFGFSALVDTERKSYTTYAQARTDVKLFKWKAADLEALFSQDFEMGFLFMKEIAKIIKGRLQIRNIQFLDIYR